MNKVSIEENFVYSHFHSQILNAYIPNILNTLLKDEYTMHYKTLIYDQHILIQLLILLEKAKYYYFMDIAHLSLGIKDYNNFINHCRAHFKHNQINSISSHCSDSQTYCFEQYNELVTHLKANPLQNFKMEI